MAKKILESPFHTNILSMISSSLKFALNLAYSVSNMRDSATPLGYMLVNEAMTPITYKAAKLAITKYYTNLNTHFFDEHIAVDEEHVADLWRAVDRLGNGEEASLRFGMDVGERGMAVLLDEAFGVLDLHLDA